MHTSTQASRKTASDIPVSMPTHTTLYDLIAAIDAEAGPDTDDVVTARVSRVLKTYRVSCLGDFKGYQMTLDDEDPFHYAVA